METFAAGTRMTHSQLEDVLQHFRGGVHKIIVATSVAEEGLDVKSCNFVIRYEHVTNDIARVQARGRARAKNAEYVLVAEPSRGAIARDEANRLREVMTKNALNHISKMTPEAFKRKIRELQEKAKVERDVATHGKMISDQLKQARNHDGDYQLRCLKCNAFGAWSSDLRVIQEAHHVTLEEEFGQRIKLEPHPRPKKYDEWEKKAKIHCIECREDWGIKAVHQSVPFHVLKVCSFIVIGPHDERTYHKKWKDIPFKVLGLSPDDMKIMSQRALSGSFGQE